MMYFATRTSNVATMLTVRRHCKHVTDVASSKFDYSVGNCGSLCGVGYELYG